MIRKENEWLSKSQDWAHFFIGRSTSSSYVASGNFPVGYCRTLAAQRAEK
jgi:hypothetical protein